MKPANPARDPTQYSGQSSGQNSARNRPARILGTVVEQSPTLAELSARVAIMAAVQKVLDQQWAVLNLRVLSMRDGVLAIATRSAAVAAKARQMEPSMLAAVRRENPSVHQIRYKAEKTGPAAAPATPVSTSRRIANDSLEELQMAASQMDPGPVRSALQRLINRQLEQSE